MGLTYTRTGTQTETHTDRHGLGPVPRVDSTAMMPLCASISFLVMLSPSPVPPNLRVAVMSPYATSRPVSTECITAGTVSPVMQHALQQLGRKMLSWTVTVQCLAYHWSIRTMACPCSNEPVRALSANTTHCMLHLCFGVQNVLTGGLQPNALLQTLQ